MAEDHNENWVFLGDSISEGVGARRTSYVSELVALLREDEGRQIVEMRLRRLPQGSFSNFVDYNVAGAINDAGLDAKVRQPLQWVWNLASEGTTTQDDSVWFPLIANLSPSRVFILRGPFESIVRPASVTSGKWPFWVPRPWRKPAGMDPRCYFSRAWWRATKQRVEDNLKQRARLRLLEVAGVTLLSEDHFCEGLSETITFLQSTGASVFVLALPCVSAKTFPGSQDSFDKRNRLLRSLSEKYRANFIEWKTPFVEQIELDDTHFLRDGFHPSPRGAQVLALQLLQRMAGGAVV